MENERQKDQCHCGTIIEYNCLTCQDLAEGEVAECRRCCHQHNAGDPDCPEEFK